MCVKIIFKKVVEVHTCMYVKIYIHLLNMYILLKTNIFMS